MKRKWVSWEHSGYVFAGIWAIFLYYPLNALLSAPHHTWVRSLGVLGIVAFAAVYISGFRTVGPYLSGAQRRGNTVRIIVMLALVGALTPILRMNVIGFTPFLIAFCIIALWRPVNWILGVGIAIGVMLTTWLTGTFQEFSEILVINLLQVVIGLFIVGMIENSMHTDKLERENLVVTERDRMARDVHDLIGHSLTVVSLKSQLAERLIDSDPERAKAELAEIQGIVSTALGGVRQTVTDARIPSVADELASAASTLRAAGVEVTIDGDPAVVTGPIALTLGWVVREATTNILRHAHAARCTFEFEASRMRISDDGDGLGGREGTGIRGMRERVAAAGGTLLIGASETGGASVEVTW